MGASTAATLALGKQMSLRKKGASWKSASSGDKRTVELLPELRSSHEWLDGLQGGGPYDPVVNGVRSNPYKQPKIDGFHWGYKT